MSASGMAPKRQPSELCRGLPSTSPFIESAVQLEILRSDRQRVALLISVLMLLLLLIFTMVPMPQLYASGIRDCLRATAWPFTLIVTCYLAYELSIRIWLDRLLSAGRMITPAFRYFNVFMEVSLPTVGILVGAAVSDSLSILAGALPFLYFLFILLIALTLDVRLCLFAGMTASVEFLVVALYLVDTSRPIAPAGFPVLATITSPLQYVFKATLLLAGGAIAGFVVSQIRRRMNKVVQALGERDRAVSIFGQQTSPKVAELLLKQPVDFTGGERNACVTFLDIRNFSKLSSERSAHEVVKYLNSLIGPTIQIVTKYSGVVNKFLGDGFMAVFGAPVDDGQRCRHVIQEILQEAGVVASDPLLGAQ